MSTLYVQNQSTVITDAQAQSMTRACAYQARWGFAPAWGQVAWNVMSLDRHAKVPPGANVIALLDDSDQAGALGYHSENPDGTMYGRVFAKPSLDNGSGVFTGEYAVSATLSHEVLEFIADPNVSYWAAAGEQQDGSPVLYAFEVCDAVEGDSYTVRDLRTDVAVSNFVLPSWFDPQATKGPFDYLRKATRPFEITKNGYAVQWSSQGQQQVFGESMPAWRRELKRQEMSRGGRRMSLDGPSPQDEPRVSTAGHAGVFARALGKLRDHDD